MDIVDFKVRGEFIIQLDTKQDWINKMPNRLPPKMFHKDKFMFIDKHGYELVIGLDFEIAKQIDSYPVRVYRKIPVRHRV